MELFECLPQDIIEHRINRGLISPAFANAPTDYEALKKCLVIKSRRVVRKSAKI
jgi:hypothetical protein